MVQGEVQAELKELRVLAAELRKLATAIHREGRLAVEEPALEMGGVKYYRVKQVEKICCLAKATFWAYRKDGKFPPPDLTHWYEKCWSETAIRFWIMERLQAGMKIEPYATQRLWSRNK